MSGTEADERTILTYLNDDCWHAVLDYVPLEDILRTEPASQEWQKVMLTYMRGIRIDIKTPPRFWKKYNRVKKPIWCNFNKKVMKKKLCRPRITRLSRWSFENWTNKLGPSVAAAYCDSTDSLKMYENCPNLETLTLIDLPEETILSIQSENFMWLKRLSLKKCNLDGRKFFEAVCRLKHLKDLCVDFYARDADLEAVTRCCPELRALRMRSCDAVSQRGLAVACAHAGSRLVVLGIACSQDQRFLMDDHIVACIRACPNLEMINVRGNRGLTRELFPRVAAVRREMRAPLPLTLRCGSLSYSFFVDQYEELKILP